jgi:hypothetical protein
LKSKRFKILFGLGVVALAIIATGFLFLLGSLPLGGYMTSEQAKVISPDGRYIASQVNKDCGATEEADWIALRGAGEPIDVNEAGEVFYITSRMRNISFRWAGPKTVIIHYEDTLEPGDPDFAFYKSLPRLDHWRDVHVIYQKTAGKAKSL